MAKSPNYAELKSQRDRLNNQLEAIAVEARAEFRERIEAEAKELEVNLYEWYAPQAPAKRTRAANKTSTSNLVPKYKDPATGETWLGRGRPAAWLQKYLEEGKSKDEFLNPEWS